jgi:lysozyme
MKAKHVYIIGGAALALLLFVPGVLSAGGTAFTAATLQTAGNSADAINQAVDAMLSQWEGFSPTPYWDVSRYSWGYGTAAPGSAGMITKAQALSDSNAVLQNDMQTLQGLISVPLNANQWAALLDFSYNLGVGNAENLVANINAGDSAALQAEWMQYVNADGEINQTLVARRSAEWQLWNS